MRLVSFFCPNFVALVILATTPVTGTGLGADTPTVKKPQKWQFDFGEGPTKDHWLPVGPKSVYDAKLGYGWDSGASEIKSRDRKTTDPLLTDFVFSETTATFRIEAAPGHYKIAVYCGDGNFGNHTLEVKVEGTTVSVPVLKPESGQFLQASFYTEVAPGQDSQKLTFQAPEGSWVLNGLEVAAVLPAAVKSGVEITEVAVKATPRDLKKVASDWANVFEWPDPTAGLLGQFLIDQKGFAGFSPTSLKRGDYLKLVAGNVDFWKKHQDETGAIIDPYKEKEWQYSTPCFVLAAATLVAHADRGDLLEAACKAMDWSCDQLRQRKGATNHEDFYPPQLSHALPMLKGKVPSERYDEWVRDLASFDPWQVYRSAPGHGNWNVVAFSGEYLLEKLGVRKNSNFVEECLGGQGSTFGSPFGLYLEGPMAYDLFPRIWAADMIAAGYDKKYSKELAEVLRRGALTSLFMQSPNGELPMGHRSAHHQWNEAEQCLTYEIYGAEAKKAGNVALAGAYKRGAHLALQSMFRWQRPSGEMSIVKNRVDPKERHAFEGYSAHSQYNLLPMAMLCIAWEHAEKTDDVQERPAPCDVGGFVFDIGERMHKVFANAGGHYVEIETSADKHYDSTGLVRIHKSGRNPQIGPSDSLTSESHPFLPPGPHLDAAIGPAWQNAAGKWRRLAEFSGPAVKWSMKSEGATPDHVQFSVTYTGELDGPTEVREEYVLTPQTLKIKTSVSGTSGPLQFTAPIFANDGEKKTSMEVTDKRVSVTLDGKSAQEFSGPTAQSLTVNDQEYPNRNGWSKLAIWQFQAGTSMEIEVRPKVRTFETGNGGN